METAFFTCNEIGEWNIFCPQYLYSTARFYKMPDTYTYISDAFPNNEKDENYIDEVKRWDQFTPPQVDCFGRRLPEPHKYPVLISAQTGKGKNYFISHKLRKHAKKFDRRILYISNRVALDYQQKKELIEATKSKYSIHRQSSDLEECEEFDNVTVITYQKLVKYFQTEDKSWFEKFYYVIIDECHFFYSDAFFNPYTGYILDEITQRFTKSVRIYMSATFDDVFEPIRYCEVKAMNNAGNLHISDCIQKFDQNLIAYEFPRDYSNYHVFFFSELEQIASMVRNSNKNEKWLIFVTNKNQGKELCNGLNSNGEIVTYIDSQSRNGDDYKARLVWEQLKNEGKFDYRALIITSVLDNGFSIKDTKVKNIVICSDDKTEFLQELGRLRISRDDQINLYIRKISKKNASNLKEKYRSYSALFIDFCGEEDSADLLQGRKFLEKGKPCDMIKCLWNEQEDSRRKLIHLVNQSDGTLRPEINWMARWRTILLGKQIEHYEELLAQDERLAPALYKAQWLTSKEIDSSKFAEYLQDHDLDIQASNQAIKDLIKFLCEEGESGKKLEKDSDSIKEFSRKFQELYVRAYPDDKSVNSGKGREPWNIGAINNHLKKIKDCEYVFELVNRSDRSDLKSGNGKPIYVLQRKNRADVKE